MAAKAPLSVSQIEAKPASKRTAEEAERLREYWRTSKARQRSPGSGTIPSVRPEPSGEMVELLKKHGVAGTLRLLERGMISWASDEPSARIRERLLDETRMISRLVATLTEPDVTTEQSRASA